MIKIITILILFLCLVSCVRTPSENSPVNTELAQKGDILVLCEGLQGYDNSALSLIKSSSGIIVSDFFKLSNNNEKLGDTANDLVIRGDTAYIVLSTASIIRMVNVNDGKKIKEIILPENCMPRSIDIFKDDLCVSCLLRSSVLIIGKDGHIDEIPVGPQPEGIAVHNNYLFVANSAYGDFNYSHEFAETISVIDLISKQEIKKISCGPNCCEVVVNNKNNKLYGIYYNLPSKENEPGGIIEYSLNDFSETYRWNLRARSVNLSNSKDSLLFISQMHKGSSMNEQSGVATIDLTNKSSNMIIHNPVKYDIWYSLTVSPFDNSIWIANALNHINNGKIHVFLNGDKLLRSFTVSQNPNNIFFVR